MKEKGLFAKLVHKKPVKFQIDCGANCADILPYKYVENEELSHCPRNLIMWNGHTSGFLCFACG